MPSGKVGVAVYIDPALLAAIEDNIDGKNRSEKIRKCVETGFKEMKRNARKT